MPKIGKLLISGIPLGLTSLFYYQSLQSLNASLAIIFLFQFVWIGSLFEWFFYKKKPTMGKLISIGILVIGSIFASGIIAEGSGEMSWQGTLWECFLRSPIPLLSLLAVVWKKIHLLFKKVLYLLLGYDYSFHSKYNTVAPFTSLNGNCTVRFYLGLLG